MVTVLVATVHIVSNKWVQVLPVQYKMECSGSTSFVTSNLLLNIQSSIVNFPLYTVYLGEFVWKCWVVDTPLNCTDMEH